MVNVGDLVYDREWYGVPAIVEVASTRFELSYGKGVTRHASDVVAIVRGTKCVACACDVTVEDVSFERNGHDYWLCNRCKK